MNGRRQSSNNIDLALLLLRLVVGVVIIAHGWQKLFLLGLNGVAGMFARMGVPFPAITGPAIGVIELLGGAAIILGLLTRLASLGVACDVLGAIVFFHAKHGFFVPAGIEFVMTLAAVALALAIAGPGEYSIDALVAGRRADAAVQPTYRSQSR
jgi:putative oxidoreductase